jgi:hypothetical protein
VQHFKAHGHTGLKAEILRLLSEAQREAELVVGRNRLAMKN